MEGDGERWVRKIARREADADGDRGWRGIGRMESDGDGESDLHMPKTFDLRYYVRYVGGSRTPVRRSLADVCAPTDDREQPMD